MTAATPWTVMAMASQVATTFAGTNQKNDIRQSGLQDEVGGPMPNQDQSKSNSASCRPSRAVVPQVVGLERHNLVLYVL